MTFPGVVEMSLGEDCNKLWAQVYRLAKFLFVLVILVGGGAAIFPSNASLQAMWLGLSGYIIIVALILFPLYGLELLLDRVSPGWRDR